MDTANKSGLTDHAMKVSGATARPTVKESFTTLMATFTKENSWTIRRMDRVPIPMRTALNTLVSGGTTSNMAWG